MIAVEARLQHIETQDIGTAVKLTPNEVTIRWDHLCGCGCGAAEYSLYSYEEIATKFRQIQLVT